jgi:hypothetical protein
MSTLGTGSVAGQAAVPAAASVNANAGIVRGRAASGASWFYWIAGLSAVSSIIGLSGSTVHFFVGLGITEEFDVAGQMMGGGGRVTALVVSLGIAGIFALFGYFASKMQQWAFLVGLALYALDAALLVKLQDWLTVAFHAWGLYRIYFGFVAARNLVPARLANAPLG